MKKIKTQVIKSVGGNFWVAYQDESVMVKARKNLKSDKIFAGDYVEVDFSKKVIERLLPRKNLLIRPYVSNVDKVLIVIAPVPLPDYLLVDKIITSLIYDGIEPVLIVNKLDIASEEFCQDIKAQYGKVCQIVFTSSLQEDEAKTKLVPYLKSGINVLTGQSAVGKSSLLKILSKNSDNLVGSLSRNGRGKNTTRHSEIFKSDMGGYLVDTPGFSSFAVQHIDSKKLAGYYVEFDEFSQQCRYNNCVHIFESPNDCAVKRALDSGKLNIKRYDRYKQLYTELKKMEDEKYE